MAGELQALAATGITVYAQILNEANGQIWNTAGAAFENYATANVGDYDVALTEQGTASGYYVGDMVAAAAGSYTAVQRQRVGGSPAESDPVLGTQHLDWNGTTIIPRLGPVTAGRPAAVNAAGQIGIDWANVGNPGNATLLSGTTVGTVLNLASGNVVSVYSGQLSGQPLTLLSGRSYPASGVYATVPPESLSGVVAASGLFTHASLNSGQSVLVYSGQLSGQLVTAASGVFATASLNSGQFALPYSGQLSGQLVTAASGVFATAALSSGQSVLVYSGQLSGHAVDLLSGRSYPASGVFAAVPPSSLSGVVPASGGHVQAALLSGQPVLVYSGQLSGQLVTAASGAFAAVPPATLSGVTVSVVSGTVFPASGAFTAAALLSGQAVNLYSGERAAVAVALLDLPQSIASGTGGSGLTVRQALRGVAAAAFGPSSGFLSGGAPAAVAYGDAGGGGFSRVTANVDSWGNRSGVAFDLT